MDLQESHFQEKPMFETELALRWRDLDAYGHVNNAYYLTLFEETRICWFATFTEEWRGKLAEPLVARIEVDYLKPLHYPDQIRSILRCERIGNSSITLRHELHSVAHRNNAPIDTQSDVGEIKPHAKGRTVLVWCNPETGRSTPLPLAVRSACERILMPAV